MTDAPTLALCIPAYNAAAFLPRLLQSAARQVPAFDEILVYDDCSTDNTADVARRFGARVIAGDVNRGCSTGKNRLLAQTRCDWVHFHDADDDLLPGFTEMAHRWMLQGEQAPDVVLLQYESRRADDDRLIAVKRYDPEALASDAPLYSVRKQITNFGLYRVRAVRHVGGFDLDPEVLYNEDCRFHMRLAFAGMRFAVEEDGQVLNIERSGSMSSGNRARCELSRLAVMRKAVAEGPHRLRTDIGLECWLVARHLGAYGHYKEMAQAVRLARELGVRRPVEEQKAIVRMLARLAPVLTFRVRATFVKLRDWPRRPFVPRRAKAG